MCGCSFFAQGAEGTSSFLFSWAARQWRVHICPTILLMTFAVVSAFATSEVLLYTIGGSGCRLVAVPAFKAVRGAIALSPVGSIPTPSATYCNLLHYGLLPITAQNSAEGFRPVE